MKYDDVLVPFVSLMRRELHANAGKGDRPGWLAMDANTALLEVYYHLAKLQKAVRNNDGPAIQEYSADVANMAMMVLDICGGLAWVEHLAGVDDDAPRTCGAMVNGLTEAETNATASAMGLVGEPKRCTCAAHSGADCVCGAWNPSPAGEKQPGEQQ
jgi:hypothetical protein